MAVVNVADMCRSSERAQSLSSLGNTSSRPELLPSAMSEQHRDHLEDGLSEACAEGAVIDNGVFDCDEENGGQEGI